MSATVSGVGVGTDSEINYSDNIYFTRIASIPNCTIIIIIITIIMIKELTNFLEAS